MYDSRLHYAGPVSAAPVLGSPRAYRVTGVTLVTIALLVIGLALVAAGIVHPAGLMLLAGPIKAVDLREQAVAKFKAAKDLVGEDGAVPSEKLDAFNAYLTEAKDLDKQYAIAAASEGDVETVAERLAFYTGVVTGQPMRFNRTELDASGPKSLGAQFVGSKAYRELKASGSLDSENSRFRSDPVVLAAPGFRAAASDVIQTEDGGPLGDGIVRPIRLPGITALQQRPLEIRALFPNETMTGGDTIEYAQQVGFDKATGLAVKQATSAADAASVKKQSSISYAIKTARAEWIATWMATTRQALADESQTRSLIDNQGRLMLALEEEEQFLNGNGTPPNLSGIYDQTIQTLDLTGRDNLDGVRDARRLVKTGTSRLTPNFIVLNPIDSEEFDLLKDDFGQYRGGNPIGNFGFDQPIWGLRRVESEAIEVGHGLVGAGVAATVFERQPITVLTADQHADFFVRNLVVILFEERLAFPIYFPTAFVDITLADWTPGS